MAIKIASQDNRSSNCLPWEFKVVSQQSRDGVAYLSDEKAREGDALPQDVVGCDYMVQW